MYIDINKEIFQAAVLTSVDTLKGSHCRNFIISRLKGPRDKIKGVREYYTATTRLLLGTLGSCIELIMRKYKPI